MNDVQWSHFSKKVSSQADADLKCSKWEDAICAGIDSHVKTNNLIIWLSKPLYTLLISCSAFDITKNTFCGVSTRILPEYEDWNQRMLFWVMNKEI